MGSRHPVSQTRKQSRRAVAGVTHGQGRGAGGNSGAPPQSWCLPYPAPSSPADGRGGAPWGKALVGHVLCSCSHQGPVQCQDTEGVPSPGGLSGAGAPLASWHRTGPERGQGWAGTRLAAVPPPPPPAPRCFLAGRGQARGCRPGDGTPTGGRQTEKRHKNLPGLRPAGSASGNSGGRVEREAPGEPQLSRTRRWLFLSPRGVLCGNWGFQARSAAQLPSSLPLFSISPSLEGGSGPGRLRARKAGGRGPGPGRGTRGAPFTEHTPGRR